MPALEGQQHRRSLPAEGWFDDLYARSLLVQQRPPHLAELSRPSDYRLYFAMVLGIGIY